MSNRLPLSVSIITLNEEANLPRCLESVRDLASEIVVIDSGSTDRTRQIAESSGAIFEAHSWQGHVAQKNIALRRCTQPWILCLDADEAISPELGAEIRDLISHPENSAGIAAFRFPRITLYCGRWIRHGDWYPDRKVRLCRRGAAEWGGIDPHDKLIANGKVGELYGRILHHSTETIDRQIAKIASYSNAFLRDAQAKRRGASWFDLMVRPPWRFFRTYFIKLGFLDGWQGWHIAWMTAFYSVTRYAKVREAQEKSFGKEAKLPT